jgi:ABC-type nitrate/sulfonate/bicarbonate transport system substrate-binding protein
VADVAEGSRAIRVGFVANPFSLPFTIAVERGYFAALGLDLETERFANGSRVSEALAEGEIDFGVSGHLQTLMSSTDDVPQVFFCPLGFESRPDHLPIALLGGDGIERGRDLEGRAVAVSAVAAISELQLRIFMAADGAEYESLDLATMPFDEMANALARGSVAAASVPDPIASKLAVAGTGRVVDRGSLSSGLADGSRALIAGLATTVKWAHTHTEVIGRVNDAVGCAFDDLDRDASLAATLLTRGSLGEGLDPSTIDTPLFDRRFGPGDLQVVFDLALAHGLIDRPADASALVFGATEPAP